MTGGGREGYFGSPVRRKTAPGARRAVLAAIATIVSEANTLAGESPLATRGDHGGARAASALLTGWLAVPPPGPGGGRLSEALLELGRIDGGPQGTVGGAS